MQVTRPPLFPLRLNDSVKLSRCENEQFDCLMYSTTSVVYDSGGASSPRSFPAYLIHDLVKVLSKTKQFEYPFYTTTAAATWLILNVSTFHYIIYTTTAAATRWAILVSTLHHLIYTTTVGAVGLILNVRYAVLSPSGFVVACSVFDRNTLRSRLL